MPRTRRAPHSRHAARTGFDAAVGLMSGAPGAAQAEGRTCHHCGAEGRIDMIDMPRTRAYLSCLVCGNKWDTERAEVAPKAS